MLNPSIQSVDWETSTTPSREKWHVEFGRLMILALALLLNELCSHNLSAHH